MSEKPALTPVTLKPPPNEDLIEELEKLLGWAREGTLIGLATVSYWHTKSVGSGWHFQDGVDCMRVLGQITDLQIRVQQRISEEPENFEEPFDDPSA